MYCVKNYLITTAFFSGVIMSLLMMQFRFLFTYDDKRRIHLLAYSFLSFCPSYSKSVQDED